MVFLFVRDLGFEPEATNVGNDLEAQMKNLLRVVALFVVVVLVASGCSYSEEAEPGIRNLKLSPASTTTLPTFRFAIPAHLSDDCERSYREMSWACLNESEQQRAAGLLSAVNVLVNFENPETYIYEPGGTRGYTNLLRLLIDFEALEVLCYTDLLDSMRDELIWPLWTAPHTENPFYSVTLKRDLAKLKHEIVDGFLSQVVSHRTEETPVLEAVRYRHLCPSWMYE